MATEFCTATLRLEDLETLLRTNPGATTAATAILAELDASWVKFHRRIEMKLYGAKMLARVEDWRAKLDATRPRIAALIAAEEKAPALAETEAEATPLLETESCSSIPASRTRTVSDSEATPPPAKVARVDSTKAISTTEASTKAMPPSTEAVDQTSPEEPVAPIAPQRKRSVRTEALALARVKSISAALGVIPGRTLSRVECEKLLVGLVLSRLSAEVHRSP